MPNPTFRRWTADDIAKLKNMAQKEPSANIAAQLGRSLGATAVKAQGRLPGGGAGPLGWRQTLSDVSAHLCRTTRSGGNGQPRTRERVRTLTILALERGTCDCNQTDK